jgi:hypothetical protein
VEVTCRLYRPGDETGIIELYRSAFNFDMSAELWRWFYVQMPEGPAAIAVAESEQGDIVGHYALQPRSFWLGGKPCVAAIAVGYMLHPSARKVNVLIEMGDRGYEACRTRNMAFLYAFPNEIGMSVHQRILGWTPMPTLTEWDGAPSAVPRSRSHTIAVWDRWPEGPVRLAPSRASAPVAGRRTVEWLRWRFFDRPSAGVSERYRLHVASRGNVIEAYAALKRYYRDGISYAHILDWQPIDASASEELFVSLRRTFEEWEVDRFSCWAEPDSSLAEALRQANVQQSGRATNFCFLDLRDGKDSPLSSLDSWSLTMAESDVY